MPSNAHFCSRVVNPTLSQAAISALIPASDFAVFGVDLAGAIVGIAELVADGFTGDGSALPVVIGVPSPEVTGVPDESVRIFCILLAFTASRLVGGSSNDKMFSTYSVTRLLIVI